MPRKFETHRLVKNKLETNSLRVINRTKRSWLNTEIFPRLCVIHHTTYSVANLVWQNKVKLFWETIFFEVILFKLILWLQIYWDKNGNRNNKNQHLLSQDLQSNIFNKGKVTWETYTVIQYKYATDYLTVVLCSEAGCMYHFNIVIRRALKWRWKTKLSQ